MKNITLSILWGFCYIACGILGFLPATAGWIYGLQVLAALVFFLPPAMLVYRGVKEKNRKMVKNIALISVLWLITACLLIVCNILSVGASEMAGNVLYYMLIVIASPMVCGKIWLLSLFLMACLMTVSLQQLKKLKEA